MPYFIDLMEQEIWDDPENDGVINMFLTIIIISLGTGHGHNLAWKKKKKFG